MHHFASDMSGSVQPSQVAASTGENLAPNVLEQASPRSKAGGGILRAERQREIALSRLKARSKANPVLNDIFEEIL